MKSLENRPEKMSGGQITLLIIVLLLAAALSLYYVNSRLYSTEFGHDEGNYIEMARQMVEEGVYAYDSDEPNAFVPPGFPVYLSLCFRLFGFEPAGLAVMRILQAVYSVLTVLLVFIFGYQLSGKYSVGIVAAGLITLVLDFYSYTFAFLTENLYYLFMMIFAVVFTHTLRQHKLWLHFLSGLLFCACVLIRSSITIVCIALYIPFIYKNRERRKYALKCAGLFLLGFVLLALPWWIRNIVVLDELVLFCDQSHIVFAGLAEDIYSRGYVRPDSSLGCLAIFADLMRNDPVGTIFWFTAGKFEIFFMANEAGMFSIISAIFKTAIVFLGLPLCVKGLFTAKYRWNCIGFFLYLFIAFLGVPTSRYGLQYLFFLSVAAACVLVTLFKKDQEETQMPARL